MAGTRAKALKMQEAAYGCTGGHCCHAAVCRQTAHGSDLHLFRGHVAEVWNDEGGQRQDVSGRKALTHSSPSTRLLF
jgi:hypothetical protein